MGAPPTAVPPTKTRPEHLTGRDGEKGKESHDQGHATAEAGDTVRSAASPTPKRPVGKNNHPGDRPATRTEAESARPCAFGLCQPEMGPRLRTRQEGVK